jgi:hypothetical protein
MAASGIVENARSTKVPRRSTAEYRENPAALTAPIIGGVVAQELTVSAAALLVNRGERTIRRYLAQGLLLHLPVKEIRR